MIAELERICDYLVVLRNGQLQIAGDIDDLRATHRMVTGPSNWPQLTGITVVSATQTASRTTALVRLDGNPNIGPGFDEVQPTFDELALGYLDATQPSTNELPA